MSSSTIFLKACKPGIPTVLHEKYVRGDWETCFLGMYDYQT